MFQPCRKGSSFFSDNTREDVAASVFAVAFYLIAKPKKIRKILPAGRPWPLARLTLVFFGPALM
jgi:hypothetical protein